MQACARPVLALLLAMLAMPAAVQDARTAEQRLETVRRELKSVAAERRKLEGERGSAARALREADEAVGSSTRRLSETRQRLADQQQMLAELQQRRERMRARLGTQREQLKSLLRAAYRERDDAPLKALLAQDRMADANRVLTYHRYLQAHRATRIAALADSVREMDAVERDIVARQVQLEATRQQLETELASLQDSRQDRAETVAGLDRRYRDRRARERALGRDAKGLEQLLSRLRAAAARAEAARKAAAENAAREAARAETPGASPPPRAARPVPAAPAPQVGGLGWPVSGALLAGYGGKLPDGRGSDGLLIGAPAGAQVRAVADGQVVYSEWMTGYGLLLIVDHGNGYMSLYAHNDALLKDPGDRVSKGEPVAAVGSSGGHGRPALYFELRRNGDPVDPTTWLRR